jgi:hypothetical protein
MNAFCTKLKSLMDKTMSKERVASNIVENGRMDRKSGRNPIGKRQGKNIFRDVAFRGERT